MARAAVAQAPRKFKIFKTITLGKFKSGKEYRKAFPEARVLLTVGSESLLDSSEFTCADQEIDVDLVVLTVSQLGSRRLASYDTICARAIKMGLQLCPAEVGPALRLAYPEQPHGECLNVAMTAIKDPTIADDPLFFTVEYFPNMLRLDGDQCSGRIWDDRSGYGWPLTERFVFVLPRK